MKKLFLILAATALFVACGGPAKDQPTEPETDAVVEQVIDEGQPADQPATTTTTTPAKPKQPTATQPTKEEPKAEEPKVEEPKTETPPADVPVKKKPR